MRFIVEIEYEPGEEETEERTREIIKGNIENCLGKVISIRSNNTIIETALRQKEDLDLLCNSLNAQAGRFIYSDPSLYHCLIRAQGVIDMLSLL